MEKYLEKTKVRKASLTAPSLENKNKDSDHTLSDSIINDVK